MRMRPEGGKRWTPGHAIWVSDVFVWRGSPAAWKEELLRVVGASVRSAADDERRHLHRIGEDPVIASLALAEGGTVAVAARRDDSATLLGPFGDAS
ncbi:MAG TPA: hypothetical protein VFG93_01955 [Gaiellaceae bacterium]|nr:hypothetical protein [Gaiellaceae bacterium]